MMKKIFFAMLVMLCLVLLPSVSDARTEAEISDWYIKKFNSEIIVNRDSSLDITETILADCGKLPDKHGIYRIVP